MSLPFLLQLEHQLIHGGSDAEKEMRLKLIAEMRAEFKERLLAESQEAAERARRSNELVEEKCAADAPDPGPDIQRPQLLGAPALREQRQESTDGALGGRCRRHGRCHCAKNLHFWGPRTPVGL